jgi:hypothetical protein
MTVHFQVAELASGSLWHLAFLQWSMVAIFVCLGYRNPRLMQPRPTGHFVRFHHAWDHSEASCLKREAHCSSVNSTTRPAQP